MRSGQICEHRCNRRSKSALGFAVTPIVPAVMAAWRGPNRLRWFRHLETHGQRLRSATLTAASLLEGPYTGYPVRVQG